MKKNPNAAFLVLRLGLGFVFIWFAISQFQNPTDWISYLPSWTSSFGISAVSFVMINGLFEIIGGILLVIGAWTRITALLLGLHLILIAFSVGYNSVAIRDIGLALATLALSWGGAGMCALDTKTEMQKSSR